MRHFSIIIFVSLFLFYNLGCKKPNDISNQNPTCKIVSPQSTQRIPRGNEIIIIAEATDPDGSIESVTFIINGVKVATLTKEPYTYNWQTEGLSIGSNTIKIISADNDGVSCVDEIKVEIIYNVISSSLIDQRDGQEYKTIEIGSQIWFAQNLNYETTNSWWYDHKESNGEIYGRLYTWYDALLACPSGWHLPTDDEWKVLELYLGMPQSEVDNKGNRGTDEGSKLKSTYSWYNEGNGTNSSSFTALPGGIRSFNDDFSYGMGRDGNWWTSTEQDSDHAWGRKLGYNTNYIIRDYDAGKAGALSVRCVKD